MNGTVDLIEELVQLRTTKGNPEELRRCRELIASRFDDTGLVVRRYEENGKPSLVVSTTETTEPEYMLHGHLDVVEADDRLFEPQIEDGRMYGRGTADMKGGLACLIEVMERLDEQDDPPETALVVVADEEIGGFDGMNYLLEEEGYRPGFAISAEPTTPGEGFEIVTKQKGRFAVDLTVEGDPTHASRPWNGENAYETFHELYPQVEAIFPDIDEEGWKTTMVPTTIEGGDATNTVMGEVTARLDIRYTADLTPDEIKERLAAIDRLSYETIFEEPMLLTHEDDPDVRKLRDAIAAVTGHKCRIRHEHYASDMRFLTEKDLPAVVFGPQGEDLHGEDECLDLDSLEPYIESLMRFLED